MKISGTRTQLSIDSTRSRAVERPSSPAKPSEKVRVSSGARSLADAKAPEAPDRARIERLTDAIREGRFQIDAAKIADVMLKEEV